MKKDTVGQAFVRNVVLKEREKILFVCFLRREGTGNKLRCKRDI